MPFCDLVRGETDLDNKETIYENTPLKISYLYLAEALFARRNRLNTLVDSPDTPYIACKKTGYRI